MPAGCKNGEEATLRQLRQRKGTASQPCPRGTLCQLKVRQQLGPSMFSLFGPAGLASLERLRLTSFRRLYTLQKNNLDTLSAPRGTW